jgi:fermentation-respiration switch protein FrsA (DUF1100 family)
MTRTRGARLRRVLVWLGALGVLGSGLVLVTLAFFVVHPPRKRLAAAGRPDPRFVEWSARAADGVTLRAWRVRPAGETRGLLVFLHGISDNRAFGTGWVEELAPDGWAFLLPDLRSQGESEGSILSYGWRERRDLSSLLDALAAQGELPGKVGVMGASLGGAVALQAAAGDPRIGAVVAEATFTDLRTILYEYLERLTPFPRGVVLAGIVNLAGLMGGFPIDDVSPIRAVAGLEIPVLFIHGDQDTHVRPAHTRALFEAKPGPKELLIVPGGTHLNLGSAGGVDRRSRIREFFRRSL